MLQVKYKQKIVCTLEEDKNIIQDLFSSGEFRHITLAGGGQLLDLSYLHAGEKVPLEYDDLMDIVSTLKLGLEEHTYSGEEEYVEQLLEKLEDARIQYKGGNFMLVCR